MSIKKFILTLSILTIFVAPMTTFAIGGVNPSDCCKLKHEIDGIAVNSIVADPGTIDDVSVAGAGDGPGCYSQDVHYTTVGGSNILIFDPISGSNIGAKEDKDWGAICFEDTVHTITDWVFWFFVALVTIMGVYVGIMFMTAGGDPTKQQKARDSIKYVVIGIVVAIAVRAIPALVRSIMGM